MVATVAVPKDVKLIFYALHTVFEKKEQDI